MPLHIIRQDITKLECDAIVNAANNTLLGGGGVDGAIHSAAGIGLLNECKTLGGCVTGDAKITKGYNLPCKYVIHTVGPIWNGGLYGEKELLENCYKKSLNLAKEYNLETIAFPLISSGVYGYPKRDALNVAVSVIKEFLLENEITVYLTVFDKASFEISKDLFENVLSYVSDNYCEYVEAVFERRFLKSRRSISEELTRHAFKDQSSTYADENLNNDYSQSFSSDLDFCSLESTPEISFPTKQRAKKITSNEKEDLSLAEMLSNLDDTFAVTLLKLIDVKGITDVECYKKANVSKQTWYKIMNEKYYKPSKNTVISFAIALKLSLEETNRLLQTVGFTLSKSCKFDVIIEYFILHKEYDVFTINETLFKFDPPCLGL